MAPISPGRMLALRKLDHSAPHSSGFTGNRDGSLAEFTQSGQPIPVFGSLTEAAMTGNRWNKAELQLLPNILSTADSVRVT